MSDFQLELHESLYPANGITNCIQPTAQMRPAFKQVDRRRNDSDSLPCKGCNEPNHNTETGEDGFQTTQHKKLYHTRGVTFTNAKLRSKITIEVTVCEYEMLKSQSRTWLQTLIVVRRPGGREAHGPSFITSCLSGQGFTVHQAGGVTTALQACQSYRRRTLHVGMCC